MHGFEYICRSSPMHLLRRRANTAVVPSHRSSGSQSFQLPLDRPLGEGKPDEEDDVYSGDEEENNLDAWIAGFSEDEDHEQGPYKETQERKKSHNSLLKVIVSYIVEQKIIISNRGRSKVWFLPKTLVLIEK